MNFEVHDSLSILFKVKDNLYSVDSSYIAEIMQLPQYETLPKASKYITGIFYYGGNVVHMLDIRCLMGVPTLQEEYSDFAAMIDDRKQDHVHWVSELDRTISAGVKFNLATNPHECKLGRWYDTFSNDSHSVMHTLRKIEEPHKKLHEAALEVEKCTQECDKCTRNECLKKILERTKEEYMPKILSLLEDTKEVFKSNVFREMVLVLKGQEGIGIVVDEVISVEQLTEVPRPMGFERIYTSAYVEGVKKSSSRPELILAICVPELIKYMRIEESSLA